MHRSSFRVSRFCRCRKALFLMLPQSFCTNLRKYSPRNVPETVAVLRQRRCRLHVSLERRDHPRQVLHSRRRSSPASAPALPRATPAAAAAAAAAANDADTVPDRRLGIQQAPRRSRRRRSTENRLSRVT